MIYHIQDLTTTLYDIALCSLSSEGRSLYPSCPCQDSHHDLAQKAQRDQNRKYKTSNPYCYYHDYFSEVTLNVKLHMSLFIPIL